MAEIITGNPYEGMKRCILNPDKTVAYFCNPTDSNKKADGTTINWTQVNSLGQNLMVQIPKFYAAKKWVPTKNTWVFGASYEPVATADLDLSDWEVHPAFYKNMNINCDVAPTGKLPEVPFRYVGAGPAVLDAQGRMRCFGGVGGNYEPISNMYGTNSGGGANLSGVVASAIQMGVGYAPLDYILYSAIAHLYICEYGEPDPAKTPVGRSQYNGTAIQRHNGSGVGSYRGINCFVSETPDGGNYSHILFGAGFSSGSGFYATQQGFPLVDFFEGYGKDAHYNVAKTWDRSVIVPAAQVSYGTEEYTANIVPGVGAGLLPSTSKSTKGSFASKCNINGSSSTPAIAAYDPGSLVELPGNNGITRLCV